MAGFECSDKINCLGNRVDLLSVTDHINQVREDYERLKPFGIKTVREGIRWSIVEKTPYHYNFDAVKMMMDVGNEMKIQQVWDLCHFGYPEDLSPLHPQFTSRFVSLCSAFAHFVVKHYGQKEMVITPINEVSFISWLGGDAAGTTPFCKNEGWNVKYHLSKAFILGIKELKRINPYFKILSTEPLVNMVPTFEATSEEVEKARNAHDNQYQTLDIICGKICQELGGDPSLIDVIGVNYYYNNQWVYKQSENSYLHWNNEDDDPRWRPLHSLIEEVYQRYQLPILLSETSHSGEDRGKWIRSIATQCQKISEMKIPFLGICLYPIIDRPDWDNGQWHHSGLWDCFPEDGISRQINQDYAIALLESQVQMKHNSLEKENIENINLNEQLISALQPNIKSEETRYC